MASDGIATVIYLSKNFVSAGRAWNLYRIAQEAVNNALTHGRGRRIDISLGFGGGKGLLSIRDDGIGIPERVPKGKGIGLHTMNYRCRLIAQGLHLSFKTIESHREHIRS